MISFLPFKGNGLITLVRKVKHLKKICCIIYPPILSVVLLLGFSSLANVGVNSI
jgi:hypothetical protein